MKIGIVGNGVVGSATAAAWGGHCEEVRVYDSAESRSTHGLVDTLESDLTFVCLPEGVVDLFFKYQVPGRLCEQNFVLKSTVPVGTTRRLRDKYGLTNLVHSPEFISERSAILDAAMPVRLIVGYPGHPPLPENTAAHPVRDAYQERFPWVNLIETSSDSSEAIKLFDNAFSSTKIVFFNLVEDLCRKAGLDWHVVRNGMLAGGRIAPDHTQVPGHDRKKGFGGRCLPKDLITLIACLDSAEVDASLLKEVKNVNDAYRR